LPTIAFVSSKGGTGKTTAALTLALGISRRFGRVALIDTDPNLPIYRWAQHGKAPAEIRVYPAIGAQELCDVLPMAQARADWTVIDTEGSARARPLVPYMRPDLLLVPLAPSTLEAVEAIKTSQSLREMSEQTRIDLPHACLFTRVPAAIRTRAFGQIVRQLRDAHISIVETALFEKEAFRLMFAEGADLHGLDEAVVSGLAAAKTNADNYVMNVLAFFARRRSGPAAA
jgi:chromosome partitioning protein